MSTANIARELLIRRRAREDIFDFINAIEVPGRPGLNDPDSEFFLPHEETIAAHHRLLLKALVDITSHNYGRLMVLMPPGSAKSTYASVVFPTHYLANQGDRKIILAGYGDDLVRKLGRRSRAIIRQPRYQNIFKTKLRDDSQAAQEFTLTNGSEYLSCGILAGVTGNRAHGLIIDDPIKGREQADSPTVRQKIFDAYEDDLKTRLIPGGWIVLIQTRWHEDDLAGRILPEGWAGESGDILCKDGNVWKVLSIQAQCEVKNDPLGRAQGEYLWKEWFDEKHWAQYKPNQRTWSALYQQIPSPLTGTLFQINMIPIIDAIPAGTKFVRAWDLASTKDGGDWTCGGLLGKMPDGRFLVADMVRVQEGPHEVEAILKATASRDGRTTLIELPQDPGQAGKVQATYLTSSLAGYKVSSGPVSGNKIQRAEPLASQANVGNLVLLRGPWNKILLDELSKFPFGTHDDQVDCLSTGFEAIFQPPTNGIFEFYQGLLNDTKHKAIA